MNHRTKLLVTALLLLALQWTSSAAAALSSLTARGRDFVDASGDVVQLRGVNLGNWLLIEPWMLGWYDIKDQHTIDSSLRTRFGDEFASAFFRRYRDAYITERDFAHLAALGFNCVRLPIDYRLVMREDYSFRDDADAFAEIDRALQWAESHGIYVILDLHGAPGGQSDQHHTGRAEQNRLWTDPASQHATVELWRRLADRYKHRSVIAAYDLLNEPWADYRTDVRPQLAELCDRIVTAIRSTGDRRVVLYPAAFGNEIAFLPDLAAPERAPAGITDHFYPGLFGSPTTVQSFERFLNHGATGFARELARRNVPMLVGEFNVVLHGSGGDLMTRTVIDQFEHHGWAWTLWSYRTGGTEGKLPDQNWGMTTNASPLPAIDVRTSPRDQIEAWLVALESTDWLTDDAMVRALLDPKADSIPIRNVTTSINPEHVDRVDTPWVVTDVGTSTGSAIQQGDRFIVQGNGRDIFASRDDFTFVHRQADDDDTLSVLVDGPTDTDRFAKAGVMLRFGNEPGVDDGFAMLNVFPDGAVAWLVRDGRGASALRETRRHVGPGPHALRIRRNGATVTGEIFHDRRWMIVDQTTLNRATLNDTTPARLGMVLSSRVPLATSTATFQLLNADTDPVATPDLDSPRPKNLLVNGSFESVGSSDDLADAWHRWGQWVNRETTWTPTRDGTALLGYHHFRRDSADDSGLWQDVRVEPGSTYRASVHVYADATPDPADRVILALEATIHGRQVTLAEKEAAVADLIAANGWSHLHVDAIAPVESLRLLLRFIPKQDAPRGGAVKIDDLQLHRLP